MPDEPKHMMTIPREHRVSHSEVESFLLCNRKHYYGYLKGLTRVEHSIALNRGVNGHAILDKLFVALIDDPNLNKAQFLREQVQASYLEQGYEPEIMLTLIQQFDAFVAEWPFDGWKILAVEKEFVLKINDSLYLPFVVDLIMQTPEGKIAVIDHKFTKDFYKPWNLELLPQLPKYMAAIKELGLPADEAYYSIFRTGFGKSATSKDIYKLIPVELTEKRVSNSLKEQVNASLAIQQVKKLAEDEQERSALRVANNLVCNSCSFKSICSAELNGYATGPLLKTEYKQKEEREFMIEVNDE